MVMEGFEDIEKKKILILCVDRDSDLTKKAEVKTPVIGRNENLNAAVALALKDPEEPDANAMFEAVRQYDRLKAQSNTEELFEIATVCGSELGGVDADRKVVSELTDLISSFPANEVILVTDGYTDEAVLPLVESRVKVSSVRRIVVKHSQSIEQTAALFTRYLKTITQNPRYSRIALGVPGVLLLIFGILSLFNYYYLFWIALVFVLSVVLVVKGFGVDKAAKNTYKWINEYSPPPLRVQISTFALIAGFLAIAVGAYLGWSNAASKIVTVPSDFGGWIIILPQIVGNFTKGAMDLLIVGICVALSGRAIRWYMEHDARLLRNTALIVLMAWSRQILDGTSDVLINPDFGYEKLIFSIVVGILIGIASVLVIFVVQRKRTAFFGKTDTELQELGEG